MPATPLMVDNGDQTLIGSDYLVDVSHFDHVEGEDGLVVSTDRTSFKVYHRAPNAAFPDNSTEEFVWVQVGDAYATRPEAVMAAVNQSQG